MLERYGNQERGVDSSGMLSLNEEQVSGLRKVGLKPITLILDGADFIIAIPDPAPDSTPDPESFLIVGSGNKTLQKQEDAIANYTKALRDGLIEVGEQAIAEQVSLSLLPKDAMLDLNNEYERIYGAPLFGKNTGYCGVRTSTVDELKPDSTFVVWGREGNGHYTDSVSVNHENPLIRAPYIVVAKK